MVPLEVRHADPGHAAPGYHHGPFERGLCFATWTPRGYAGAAALAALADLAATGASHVAVVVTAYVRDAEDSEVAPHPNRTPEADAVAATLRAARALGLTTVLKPHVDVVGGGYRGALVPSDRARWFESYRQFLVPWAALAAREGCASLWVGTELSSMTPDVTRWADLVAAVRGVFGGTLAYAANWTDVDEASTREVWRLVDLAGVDAYFPLGPCPRGADDMTEAWAPWLAALEDVARGTGRPVVVSEVGCASRAGAAATPWDVAPPGTVDVEHQAAYYVAALDALAPRPWLRGIYFWAWGLRAGGLADTTHSPRGKPAAEVLHRRWRP
jgi:hypothetical protein